MYKLVILIEYDEGQKQLDDFWSQFLYHAEQMPGLLKETTSRVDRILYGEHHYSLVHELYFNTVETLQAAMSSPAGKATGEILQKITGGKMALLLADHREQSLADIRKSKIKGATDDR